MQRREHRRIAAKPLRRRQEMDRVKPQVRRSSLRTASEVPAACEPPEWLDLRQGRSAVPPGAQPRAPIGEEAVQLIDDVPRPPRSLRSRNTWRNSSNARTRDHIDVEQFTAVQARLRFTVGCLGPEPCQSGANQTGAPSHGSSAGVRRRGFSPGPIWTMARQLLVTP